MNANKWSQTAVVASLFLCGAGSDAMAGTYTTDFPLTENPISEGGNWINGGTVGLDWTNVATSNGLAHGTENGTVNYNDSTAILTGTWGSNQTAQATVHVGTRPTSGNFIELELRLRSKLSAHSCTGYECNFSMAGNSVGPYAQIVRWNGALGSFTELDGRTISQIPDGAVVKAAIVGNTITTYVNGVALYSVTDSTFMNGNPGIGFYLQGSGQNDSGFTQFSATDGITNQPIYLVPGITNAKFGFSFQTVAGQSYTIQQDTNLVTTNWVNLTNVTGAGGSYQISMPATNGQTGLFFRVREP